MIKTLLIAALPALAVLAQVEPAEPAPGDTFKEGDNCAISWAIDATGTWKELNIQLMTGSNQAMQHLTTVATVDGTKDSQFSYKCPDVTVNSAIYFYQFSTPAAPTNLTWTGRFAISDEDGKTTPPSETTDGIAWGTGALKDASSAKPAPSYLSGLASSGANSSAVADSPLSATGSSLTPSSASTVLLTATSGSGSAPSGISTQRTVAPANGDVSTTVGTGTSAAQTSQTTSGAAALAVDFRARGVQALAGLAGTALIFATLF